MKADSGRSIRKYVQQVKKVLQPSRKHYGGQGYAKESQFIDLADPDFADKFVELWDEHIPGFTGKVRSSASCSALCTVRAYLDTCCSFVVPPFAWTSLGHASIQIAVHCKPSAWQRAF